MDDTLYGTREGLGTRDGRDDWKPSEPIRYPPVFIWPPRPLGAAGWLFGPSGYILSWNLLYAAIAVGLFLWLTPPMDVARSLAPGWIAWLLVRNAILASVFFGALHIRLYVRRRQSRAFKFNGRWPSGNPAFLFGNQTLDNMVWTLASGVPLWTAYEALTLWAFANGYIPFVAFSAHPVYCAALMLLIPLWRELHFYAIHRLLHWPPLYRTVHKLHHANVNPAPWSGLAMHPVEHLLYFSAVLLHWIVPSHPVHAIYNLVHLGLAPAPGHSGFDRVVVGGGVAFDTHSYAHYLHHKYFECNYADGAIPLDRWFGSFHDGSAEAQQRMEARLKARALRRRTRAVRGGAT